MRSEGPNAAAFAIVIMAMVVIIALLLQIDTHIKQKQLIMRVEALEDAQNSH